jgi:hypothetical protein
VESNVKEAIAEGKSWLDDIDKSGRSGQFFVEQVSQLSPEELEAWVVKLENEQDYLSVVMQFNDNKSITYENNIIVARKRGVPIFQRIWYVDPNTKQEVLGPELRPVYLMPVRRQIETIDYKISYSSSNMKVDAHTGQVIGNDQASRISYPELMIVYSKELNWSLVEFMKYRGGDVKGRVEFNNLLRNTGDVAMENLLRTKTVVKSTETLQIYFLAMHWQVNLTN